MTDHLTSPAEDGSGREAVLAQARRRAEDEVRVHREMPDGRVFVYEGRPQDSLYGKLVNIIVDTESRAAAAEAEVARLKEALEDTITTVRAYNRQRGKISERSVAAEASASALRERVKVLEEAIRPFAALDFSFDGFSCEPAALVFNRREYGQFLPSQHAAFKALIDAARAALTQGGPNADAS